MGFEEEKKNGPTTSLSDFESVIKRKLTNKKEIDQIADFNRKAAPAPEALKEFKLPSSELQF